VLCSLVAHSRSAARAAATTTLEQQSQGITAVSENVTIRSIAEQNAVESAHALAPFIDRKLNDVPQAVMWSLNGEEHRNFTRVDNELSQTMSSACIFAPLHVQPPSAACLRITWSVASTILSPHDDRTTVLPGVMERLQTSEKLKKLGKRQEMMSARIRALALGDVEAPTIPDVSGLTRSTISMKMRLRVHPSVFASGDQMGKELCALSRGGNQHNNEDETLRPHEEAAGLTGSTETSIGAPNVLSTSCDEARQRREPLCTPASAMVVGIEINEELRAWMGGKTRRNDPVRVAMSHISHSERAREVGLVVNTEPFPLAAITDVDVEILDGSDDDAAEDGDDVGEDENENENENEAIEADEISKPVRAAVALHVVGDSIVRVPEALSSLVRRHPSAPVRLTLETRSLLLAALSQSSWMNDVGPSISAGWTNSAIASSKKVSIADLHRLLMLSPFDVYVGGLGNLDKTFPLTPYAGIYSSPLDSGVTSPGLLGHNYKSDRRQHGSMTLSDEAAEEMTRAFVERHHIKVGEKSFVEIPPSVRGIPHVLTPGVHSALDTYIESLNSVRADLGREDANFVNTLLVLPFSPFSQALPPFVDAITDPSTKFCIRDPKNSCLSSGHCYLPDATCMADAIIREPLFRRPSQVNADENAFATSYSNVEAFFATAATLVLFARSLTLSRGPTPPREPSIANVMGDTAGSGPRVTADFDSLKRIITSFVTLSIDARMPAQDAILAADALTLINLAYPTTWSVAEPILLHALDIAIPKLHSIIERVLKQLAKAGDDDKGQEPPINVPALAGLLALHSKPLKSHLQKQAENEAKDCDVARAEAEMALEQTRAFWGAFCRSERRISAWESGLLPLLQLLDKNDGSHDLSVKRRSGIRRALERAVQSAWLVHSVDGRTPPPVPFLAECKSPTHVRRHHVDPVFASTNSVTARSALVGLKQYQLRQALTLALGAHVPGGRLQVARNEGGLSLRVSSAADILTKASLPRSDKAVSPIQTEAAGSGFGDRKSKLIGCKLQRTAWDANALYLTPIFASISPPLPWSARWRGDFATAATAKLAAIRVKRESGEAGNEEVFARNLLVRGAMNPFAMSTHSLLHTRPPTK